MYGIVRNRKKTTIYLPGDLKAKLEKAAEERGVSEALVVRDALEEKLEKRERPEPRIPLGPFTLGRPDIVERVNELLDGFGE
jgi:Ribbon-helix-helix protein, copG family